MIRWEWKVLVLNPDQGERGGVLFRERRTLIRWEGEVLVLNPDQGERGGVPVRER